MTTKTIDNKGRLALGSKFAGQLVLIDDADPDKIVITMAKAVPKREAWLYANKKAIELVRQGLAEASTGDFSETVPDSRADAALVAKLAD
jgi:hypothetical protein